MRFTRMMFGAVVLLLAASAQAQEPTNTNQSVTERLRAPITAPQIAPRLTAEEVKLLSEKKAPAQPAAAAQGRSVAYMVAGAALLIGGAIVDGDAGAVLMVGGVVIGAYGLYLHFR